MNTSELKGYLTGLIIGDGHICKGVNKRAFKIKSINKDFIDKIKEDIDSCNTFNTYVKHTDAYTDKNNVHHKEYWELSISAHPYFSKKYHNFYDDYKNRIVTKNAMNWLTPNGLANWYMSDGYVCLVGLKNGYIKNRRIEICTDRYNYDDIKMMCDKLYKNFGIEFHIIKRGNAYRIRLQSKDYINFINLIKPYIVPSMMYKLYLGYEKQPKWMSDTDWEFQNSISAIALAGRAVG